MRNIRKKGDVDFGIALLAAFPKGAVSGAMACGLRHILALWPPVVLVFASIESCSPEERGENISVIREIRAALFIPVDSAGGLHLTIPEWYRFPPGTKIDLILDTLGNQLERRYFRTYGGRNTGISLGTRGIYEIPAGSRLLRIGVVVIDDPQGAAMSTFFQGSFGARATRQTFCATFTQPQLSPPLLDGVTVLYNDTLLPPMAHIDLSGILTPDQCRREVVMGGTVDASRYGGK